MERGRKEGDATTCGEKGREGGLLSEGKAREKGEARPSIPRPRTGPTRRRRSTCTCTSCQPFDRPECQRVRRPASHTWPADGHTSAGESLASDAPCHHQALISLAAASQPLETPLCAAGLGRRLLLDARLQRGLCRGRRRRARHRRRRRLLREVGPERKDRRRGLTRRGRERLHRFGRRKLGGRVLRG